MKWHLKNGPRSFRKFIVWSLVLFIFGVRVCGGRDKLIRNKRINDHHHSISKIEQSNTNMSNFHRAIFSEYMTFITTFDYTTFERCYVVLYFNSVSAKVLYFELGFHRIRVINSVILRHGRLLSDKIFFELRNLCG